MLIEEWWSRIPVAHLIHQVPSKVRFSDLLTAYITYESKYGMGPCMFLYKTQPLQNTQWKNELILDMVTFDLIY